MTVSTLPPGHDKLMVPSFTIQVNGTPLAGTIKVISFVVSSQVNRVASAKLVLHDGNPATQDFELSSGQQFIPGAEVTISAGYEQKNKTIFKGIVVKHGIKASSKGNSILMLELRHKAVEKTVIRKNMYHKQTDDATIANTLLGGLLGTSALLAAAKKKDFVQYYCTDWDFLLSRVEANGMLVICDDTGVNIVDPQKAAKLATFTLTYGSNVIDFEAEVDARDQYGSVTSEAWKPADQKPIKKDAPAPSLSVPGNFNGKTIADKLKLDKYTLQNSVPIPEDELEAWAKNALMRSRLSLVRGKVKIYGTNSVSAGDLIPIAGFGDRFNGTAFVSGVIHSFDVNGTWITDYTIGLDREPFYEKYPSITDKPAAGLLPSISGLHTGIVTKIVEDPDNELRIKVRIPLISTSEEGVWARMARPDAGKDRGMIFRPYVDDEVLLGFVNDDPRSPVILGMLHSSKNTPPADFKSDSDDKNYIRGFFTKEKIKFLFDDEKKIVTIETPGKNSIVIDDDKKSITLKDQNKNEIVMDDKGITLKSGKDVIVDASTGKFEVKAKEVKISATTSLEAKGASKAEFGSNGTTAVSGSQISIG